MKGFAFPRHFKSAASLLSTLSRNNRELLAFLNSFVVRFDADASTLTLPGNLSVAGDLSGLSWKVWSPTYVDLTIGNGTVVSRYVEIGGFVVARFEWIWGSTSVWTSTAATITLPVAIHASGYTDTDPIGVASFRDAGTLSYPGWAELDSGKVALRVQNASGTYTSMVGVSATVPFTWTTSDILSFTVVYEAA